MPYPVIPPHILRYCVLRYRVLRYRGLRYRVLHTTATRCVTGLVTRKLPCNSIHSVLQCYTAEIKLCIKIVELKSVELKCGTEVWN